VRDALKVTFASNKESEILWRAKSSRSAAYARVRNARLQDQLLKEGIEKHGMQSRELWREHVDERSAAQCSSLFSTRLALFHNLPEGLRLRRENA
jgi:hypothetical protein